MPGWRVLIRMVMALAFERAAAAEDFLAGANLYNDVARYASFGSHRFGSPGDRATADWIAGELQAALNHEVAHVRRRDNLKKLMLRCVAFPGMTGLEAAWLEATEMAADDAAVSNAGEALDLASALVKLSRLQPVEWATVDPTIGLTAALVHGSAAVVSARVERLIAWSSDCLAPPKTFSPWYGLGAAAATVAVFLVTYGHLLVQVHMATEWLVR